MNCRVRGRAIAMVSIAMVLLSALPRGQANRRAIPYHPSTPLADRLVIGDTSVVVTKNDQIGQVLEPPVPKTFDQEIRGLSGYGSIAVVTVSDREGQLVDAGTWLRTRIRGFATERLKSGTLIPSNGLVEFWADGGQMYLGSVAVAAEPYTEFAVGERYLVFLRTDIGRGTNYAAMAYHVGPDNTLQSIRLNDGTQIMPDSTLVGRGVPEIAAALSKLK